MSILLDLQSVDNYHSNSQLARVLTEAWTEKYMYCPVCGWPTLSKFPNNRKVADFYCSNCKREFEQKSVNGVFGNKIPAGAYSALIERITSNNNPDFFLMSYSRVEMRVENMFFVPRHFFVPDVVEKRNPLKEGARRPGWVGSNILLYRIPDQGRIAIIKDGIVLDKDKVLQQVNWAQRIKIEDVSARGWLMDILNCVNAIDSDVFTLDMMYSFENELGLKYPSNNHIRDKIRQQLQQLRDRGIISFLGNGHYQKLSISNSGVTS